MILRRKMGVQIKVRKELRPMATALLINQNGVSTGGEFPWGFAPWGEFLEGTAGNAREESSVAACYIGAFRLNISGSTSVGGLVLLRDRRTVAHIV